MKNISNPLGLGSQMTGIDEDFCILYWFLQPKTEKLAALLLSLVTTADSELSETAT